MASNGYSSSHGKGGESSNMRFCWSQSWIRLKRESESSVEEMRAIIKAQCVEEGTQRLYSVSREGVRSECRWKYKEVDSCRTVRRNGTCFSRSSSIEISRTGMERGGLGGNGTLSPGCGRTRVSTQRREGCKRETY